MQTFDFVIIGAGPAGEGAAHKARELGATVAIVDRRWFGGSCPHIGCVPSKALLHSAERHWNPAPYDWAARLGAARLHGQPPAGAAEPDDRRMSRSLEARARRLSAAPAGSPRRVASSVRPTTAVHELGGDERDRRGRLGVQGPADRGPRRDPTWTNSRRPSPASCRRACSSSAAARPAASSPRSSCGSASRRRSCSRARGWSRPSTRATRRPCGWRCERDGVVVLTGRPRRARTGRRRHGRRARDRPRRRLDRRGARDPARGRPGVPARRPRDGALRRRHVGAGRRSRATAGCASPTGCGSSATRPGPSCTPTRAHYQGELAVRMALGEDDRARLPRAAAGDVHGPGVGVRRRDARPGDRARHRRVRVRRRLRDEREGLLGRGEDRARDDRDRPGDAGARRGRDGVPGRVRGDPRVRRSRSRRTSPSTSWPRRSTRSRRRRGSSTACSPRPDEAGQDPRCSVALGLASRRKALCRWFRSSGITA